MFNKIKGLVFLLPSLAVASPGLSDPTRPPEDALISTPDTTQVRVQQSALQLSATLFNEAGQSAVINNQRVLVGERISGWEIKAIFPGRVVIQKGGELSELRLVSIRVKKPANDGGVSDE